MSDTPLTDRVRSKGAFAAYTDKCTACSEAQLQALVAEQVSLAVAEYKIKQICDTCPVFQNIGIMCADCTKKIAELQKPKPPQVGTMPCKTCGADRAKEPCKHRDISQCAMREAQS